MAITATDKGTGSENSSNTSTVITMTSMTAGNVGILCIATDNATGGTSTNFSATSYNDSVGNVWYQRTTLTNGTANTTAETAIYSSALTSNTSSSNTLTISYNTATVAKAWTWTEASTAVSGAQVLWAGSSKSTTTTIGSDTSAPSGTSATVGPGDLVIAMMGMETPDIVTAFDTDTSNGSWSTAQHTGIGTGAAGMSICSQNKIANAYGTQSYDLTLSTTATCRPSTTIFTECDARARAVSGSGQSETTSVVSVVRAMAAGSIGVMCFAADNAGALGNTQNLPSTITDIKNNTWTLRQNGFADPGAVNNGVELGIYTSVLTTPLVIGDTVSPTYPVTVPFKSWVIYEIAPGGSGVMTYVAGGVGTASTTTAPSVTTSSISNGDYVVGMAGAEAIDGLTGDSDTTNGNWGPASALAVGTTAASAMAIISQIKQVTATATQSYDVTTPASTDSIAGWVSVHDSSIGIPARQAAGFFQMFR